MVAEGTHAELMDSFGTVLMTIEEGYRPLSSGGATRADIRRARETRERSMALLRQMLRPHRGALLVLSIISVLLRPGQPRLCRF